MILLPVVVAFWTLARSYPQADINKHVTLDLRQTSVADVVKGLSQTTGVSITASSAVSNRAITVICSDRPAKEVLDAIASCLLDKITPVEHGLLLEDDPDVVRDETEQVKVETEVLKRQIRNVLEQCGAYSGLSQTELMTKLVTELTSSQSAEAPDQRTNAAIKKSIFRCPSVVPVACALSSNIDEAVDELVEEKRSSFPRYRLTGGS